MERISPENLVINTAVPTEKLKQNVLDAAQYNIAPINNLIGAAPRDGTIALIGGGPSLVKTVEHALTQHNIVMVAGSAHDYVLDSYEPGDHQEVFCILCDPDPIMCDYVRYKNENVTYLIASQCDKTLFEHLSDMPHKYIWHASAGDEFNKVFPEGSELIYGGCTIGTRAIGMAIAMGYKKVHLYGYDSCLSNQYKHHAYDFVNPDRETLGDIREIRFDGPESPVFRVAGYMLSQIFDFQNIIHTYYNKLDITVHGDGALAYLMKVANQRAKEYIDGYPTKSDGPRSTALPGSEARL